MARTQKKTQETQAPRLFVETELLKELMQTAVQDILQEEVARHLGGAPRIFDLVNPVNPGDFFLTISLK